MDIQRIRQIIFEEIYNFLNEAEGDKEKEKIDKDKEDIAQQKNDIAQQKLDFSKQQAADSDREADQRDAEKEKEDKEKEAGAVAGTGAKQQKEPEKKSNISFKTQGKFYENAYPELRNLVLNDGNLLDNDERKYVALAVQAAQGRVDKEFEKFLRKGRAGNVYGKDFSDEDIQKIIEYCKKHELVR